MNLVYLTGSTNNSQYIPHFISHMSLPTCSPSPRPRQSYYDVYPRQQDCHPLAMMYNIL